MEDSEEKKVEYTVDAEGFRVEPEPYQAEAKPVTDKTPVKEEKKKKGSKISSFILAIIFLGLACWNLYTAFNGLFLAKNHPMEEVFTEAVSGQVYKGDVIFASTEYCKLTHTVNAIPIGVEHFYIIYSDDLNYAISVRAKKNWLGKIPDSLLEKIEHNEKGIVRSMNYKVKNNLKTLDGTLSSEGIELNMDYYVDFLSVRMCILSLCAGILLIICVVTSLLFGRKKTANKEEAAADAEGKVTKTDKRFTFFIIPVIVATCILELYTVAMML